MLKKCGGLYQKEDKNGNTYLVGKMREVIPEGTYLYIFKNRQQKEYETSADFYVHIQTRDGETNE